MDRIDGKAPVPEIDYNRPVVQVCFDTAGRMMIFNKGCSVFEAMTVMNTAINVLEDKLKREAIVRPQVGFDPRKLS